MFGESAGYSVHFGYRVDGRAVKLFATLSDAKSAAKAIGWPASSIERVHTRFCEAYSLRGGVGQGFLSPSGFERLISLSAHAQPTNGS